MSAHQPIAIRDGKLITHYVYRDVKIIRENSKMFVWEFCRFDMQNLERYGKTLKDTVNAIDEILNSTGRTFGGKVVVTSVENGKIVSALSNFDSRFPYARLIK
jgi:hypothetical protein